MALVAAATLLTGLLQAAAAVPSQAAAGSGSRTASLAVDSIAPRIPAKGETITLSGRIANDSKSTITDAHVGIRMPWGGALRTRSSIKSAASRVGYSNAEDGNEIPDHVSAVPDIPAGGHATFSISVPVNALELEDSGVYQIGVALDGGTNADPSAHVLGIKRTFLPWYGDAVTSNVKQTRISYLWPLTDRSHVAPRGDTDSQASPIFMDDDLAKELAAGGRLRQMIDLASNLPVTWVVDPDLLATIDFMTKGYRVAGPGGDVTKTTPGTGTAVAKQWLNLLKAAVAGDQVIVLPFGDTDIASVAHHGQSVPGTLTHLKTGATLGLATTETIFGGAQTADVAWPVDGAIDPSIVSVARASGAKRIIARSDTFRESDSLSYTPNAARPIGHGTTAVVSDAMLSTAFTGDMLDPQQTNLAVQNFIAQTLMITMEAPERQRNIVVAPQRMPTAAQAQAMAQAINESSHAPWVSPVFFDDVAKAHPDARANRKVPSAKAYPRSLRKQELPKHAFEQIQQDQKHLNSFVVILTDPDHVTVPFRNAIQRSMSTEWRGDPTNNAVYLDAVGDYLQDLINGVYIISKSALTLSGRSGTIPVTVKNELGQPVNLVLRLTSGANIRLEIKNADQPITIEGGHTRTLKFQTTANANGTVGVRAGLYTADGQLYGQAIDFEVHVNKVTDLVMLIIGAGLLLLVLAGVRIYRQRKRQAAGDGGEDNDENGDDGEADGTDPEQPGDPAADTGQESPEPSPTGEKVDG